MSATNPLLHRLPVYESIMPTSFRLSVLVPVYNERHVIEASLRRVLAPYGQRLFRPPFGRHNAASRLHAWWLGYRTILWDLDARDWLDDNAPSITARLVRHMHAGSIVLLHDGLCHPPEERDANRQPMHEALAMVLQRLDGRFRFVTIPELMQLAI
jgi:peptidoglycan/xylan/chitin deacetylase (PgdA/CDA1 family)